MQGSKTRKPGKVREGRVKTSVGIPERIHSAAKKNCLQLGDAINACLLWYLEHPAQRDEVNAYYRAQFPD